MTRVPPGLPLACVIGTIDLVRPLGLAGIRSAVVAPPANIARWSRFAATTVEWADPWSNPQRLLDRLIAFGEAQPEPPVLFYEGDWDLLLVSRNRERLGRCFRFVIADAAVIEDVVDKARFAALARDRGLPVPASARVTATASDIRLRFPVIVKPITRQTATWEPLSDGGKAVQLDEPSQLDDLVSRLSGDLELLAQELIPGAETRIESYHAYVDGEGALVAEFTGRKIRTRPALYGHSTALEITDRDDVRRLGRSVVEQLGLRGVAKLDFKRDDQGRLWLLEVNPRFNLWHHPAARAGLNVPALVYRDLLGLPRGPVAAARPGVRWVNRDEDARAAREAGIPLWRWLPWALTCEAKSGVALDDPAPFLQGCWKLLGQSTSGWLTAGGAGSSAKRGATAVARRLPGRAVDWGTLRRLRPFSSRYGYDRGLPVDRFYIERFLSSHRQAIRGDVLEVKDSSYTNRFGTGRVLQTHVVDVDPGNRRATLVADVCVAGSLPRSAFDCIILTQTLQYLADVDSALHNLWASLRPGGDLLVTAPGVAPLDPQVPEFDLRRLTPSGLEAVLRRSCPEASLLVEGHGNVLVAVAFALGLATEELSTSELAANDPGFPVLVCARATKPALDLPAYPQGGPELRTG
jgi:predicted ATP-grasp superfamily ATP-dependent carboligase